MREERKKRRREQLPPKGNERMQSGGADYYVPAVPRTTTLPPPVYLRPATIAKDEKRRSPHGHDRHHNPSSAAKHVWRKEKIKKKERKNFTYKSKLTRNYLIKTLLPAPKA